MRIVAGKHRGRVLQAPEGLEVRPTADRAREALFNILAHKGFRADGLSPVRDAIVLDAFAGTGALGLEALSRGAAHVTFMETDRRAVAAIRANVAALREEARTSLREADATRPPAAPPAGRTAPCTLVFLDPPYGHGLGAPALTALAARGWIAADAICVIELEAKEPFAPPEGFTQLDERRYGKARLVFLTRTPD